jgi:hypothetical protein
MFCILKYGCLLYYLVVKKANNCTFPFLEKKVICEPEVISLRIDFTPFIILTEFVYGTVHSNNMLLSFSGTVILQYRNKLSDGDKNFHVELSAVRMTKIETPKLLLLLQ